MSMNQMGVVQHYFVDEAGDATLFGKGGRILVGTPGCSHTFMLGLAKIPDPVQAENVLTDLRRQLLADPYFKGIPSMQPGAKKAAICFHAKDDLPEVRREVFRLIATLNVELYVAIRRKAELARIGVQAKRLGGKAMIGPDHLYDDLVKRVSQGRLHKADENKIVFARRGKSLRIRQLASAIEKAKRAFAKRMKNAPDRPTSITSLRPSECVGLQVVDYYLWALQRLYERGEDRFFEAVRNDYRLIIDVDDRRQKPYGEWYSVKNPLTLEKMKAL